MTLVCGSWNVAEAEPSGLFDEVIPFDFFPRTTRPVRKCRRAKR